MLGRRRFLAGVGGSCAGFSLGPSGEYVLKAAENGRTSVGLWQDISEGFRAPPGGMRPWVVWFWVNGNVTHDGVTTDLEAMRKVGIGGVQIMNVDPGVPAGDAQFGTDLWHDLFDHTVREAARLGLQIEMSDSDGWTGSAGPWITPEQAMKKIVWSSQSLSPAGQTELPQPTTVQGFYRDIAVLAVPASIDAGSIIPDLKFKAGFATAVMADGYDRFMPPMPVEPAQSPPEACLPLSAVRDVTSYYTDGVLNWKPEGQEQWRILRFGYTATGRTNHPASKGGLGLECDKLSRRAIQAHLEAFFGKIVERNRKYVPTVLTGAHIDSWEVGPQNWTDGFEAEFQRLRGYDPLPWLPALAGWVVDDTSRTERFLWDFRKTISDLVIENYAAEAARTLEEMGVGLSIEAYDADPTEQLVYAAQATVPQAEFWYGRDFFKDIYRSWDWVAAMTSSAHVYGRTRVAAEAFTAMPDERWLAHPATMKPLADWAFSTGINHLIIHRYAMQPWPDLAPGMTMGAWGCHYERTQTWWSYSGPWHDYLARCQYMLQQGTAVADLLCLTPEGAPSRFVGPDVDIRSPSPPLEGVYRYDGCPAQALTSRASIRDGRLALPDGKTYFALVLPEYGSATRGVGMMTPETLARIRDLVEQGMTLIGPPPTHSPSLSHYPQCDARLAELVTALWGAAGQEQTDRRVGRGRVVSGMAAEEVLRREGVAPSFTSPDHKLFHTAHRRRRDGTDIFFVANRTDRPVHAVCSFRARGECEVWEPETGAKRVGVVVERNGDQSTVPLALGANESVFVVFPVKGASPLPISAALVPEEAPPIAVQGPWHVEFLSGRGAPQSVVFPDLQSWSENHDPAIKYYAGEARYTGYLDIPAKRLTGPAPVILDLGDVCVVAEVFLNGKSAGIVWRAPFVVDIGRFVREGRNEVSIVVANLWPNRLIGDETLPDDAVWEDATFGPFSGFGKKLLHWPDWLEKKTPRASGRQAFATWKLWAANDKLIKAGLIGPVLVRSGYNWNEGESPQYSPF